MDEDPRGSGLRIQSEDSSGCELPKSLAGDVEDLLLIGAWRRVQGQTENARNSSLGVIDVSPVEGFCRLDPTRPGDLDRAGVRIVGVGARLPKLPAPASAGGRELDEATIARPTWAGV
jgi:hypothetical protein